MDLQAMFDGLGARWQKERAGSQMTLGSFIERLEELPKDVMIDGICEPHSYRGYYCDLSFEPMDTKQTVAEALAIVNPCLGEVFTGYKGGEFGMTKATPIWIAYYGCCGKKIMGINDDGSIILKEDD